MYPILKQHIISALLFISALTMAQSTNVVFIDSVEIEAELYYGKDALGYDYFSKNNVLYKLKKSEKWEYKNLPLGKIHSVDFINPLKILVFYKDFNTAVLLDNQLSEISKITLNDWNIVAQTCSIASQNRLWVYDNLTNQLILVDYLNKKNTLINQPFKNTFKYYKSDYNNWICVSERNTVLIYDNYGKVTSGYSVPEFDKMMFTQNLNILFSLNDNLYLYKGEKLGKELIFSSDKPLKDFHYTNETLTIFTGNTLYNYKINSL